MGVVGSGLEPPLALPSPPLQRTGSVRIEGGQADSGSSCNDGGAAVKPDQPSVEAGTRASKAMTPREYTVVGIPAEQYRWQGSDTTPRLKGRRGEEELGQ